MTGGDDRAEGSRKRRLLPGARSSRKRSLAKAVSWRCLGTLDTLMLSWVILTFLSPYLGREEQAAGDNLETASYIAVAEIATKLALYYFHERIWDRASWNLQRDEGGHGGEGLKRSAAKTATWRITASLDTFLLALLFTGNVATAVSIGGLEVITKLVLYFGHERVWSQITYGLRD